MDSVRITMKGTGSINFYFESQLATSKFATPDDAWGFHGDTVTPKSETVDQVYSFPTSHFWANAGAPELGGVTWDQVKNKVSTFGIELNTDSDDNGDFADIEIDKIEFVSKDTTFALPF